MGKFLKYELSKVLILALGLDCEVERPSVGTAFRSNSDSSFLHDCINADVASTMAIIFLIDFMC
jgi:hypothetical protein